MNELLNTVPFINSLFGSIVNSNVGMNFPVKADFIPTGGKGQTMRIKGSAKWWGLTNKLQQKRAYEFCFPVSTVIDRLAEAEFPAELQILRKKGKGADGFATSDWAKKVKKLLEQPNELQSWEEFRGQQLVEKRTYGYVVILPLMPAGHTNPEDAYALLNLPGDCVKPISNRVFQSGSMKTRIKCWELTILGKTVELQPDQVFVLKDGFHLDSEQDYLVPQSKLVGLDMAVSNLCAAMEADNVLLRKKGPLGVISHDASATKDSQVGYIPMTKLEKKRIQADLQQYGLSLSQYQYIISRTPIKYVPFSYNVGELRTSEKIKESTEHICQKFNYPPVLYNQADTAFANSDNASAMLYQTNIMPNAIKDMNQYNKWFKADDNNGYIWLDFSGIPFLQEDAKNEADAALSWNQALSLEFTNNQITRDEWRVKRGWPPLPNGEGTKYFRDEQKAPEPATPPIADPNKPVE